MGNYNHYQEKLEKQFNKSLKDILVDYYITRDLGPSISAKELGVPRNMILFYVNQYGLKEAKHQNYKKKVLS